MINFYYVMSKSHSLFSLDRFLNLDLNFSLLLYEFQVLKWLRQLFKGFLLVYTRFLILWRQTRLLISRSPVYHLFPYHFGHGDKAVEEYDSCECADAEFYEFDHCEFEGVERDQDPEWDEDQEDWGDDEGGGWVFSEGEEGWYEWRCYCDNIQHSKQKHEPPIQKKSTHTHQHCRRHANFYHKRTHTKYLNTNQHCRPHTTQRLMRLHMPMIHTHRPTPPTKLLLTPLTYHIRTPPVLLNHYSALRTWLPPQQLSQVVQVILISYHPKDPKSLYLNGVFPLPPTSITLQLFRAWLHQNNACVVTRRALSHIFSSVEVVKSESLVDLL